MRYIVGVSDMKVGKKEGDVLITYALGSCIGIAVHDPTAKVGGMLHYMLPLSNVDYQKAKDNPYMFGDVGIPLLFKQLYRLGASKNNLEVRIAGGAEIFSTSDIFAIGQRNIVIARKLFWKNNILISSEHVGGSIPRTLYLEVGTGKTWITSRGERFDL